MSFINNIMSKVTGAGLKTRMMKKASQSICRYKISVIGFDRKGKVVGLAINKPRFDRLGGGLHAEMNLMAQYGENIKTIVICRISNRGELLPIHPCKMCRTKMKELNIKYFTIADQKEK